MALGCKKSDPKVNNSYQPVNKDTYWKYDNNAKLTSGTSVRTMTGESAVLNGKTYYKFTVANSNGSTQFGWYGQINGNYFLYEDIPGIGGFETLYLKENATVGETWANDAANNGATFHRVSGKIIEKNIDHVVGGKTYNNVIHTRLITQYKAASASVYTDVQTLDYYVAKGIGIIEATESTGASGIRVLEYAVK